jgi:hypothetical protein
MQVGFIRLAHLKCPKSGKPDFGWSIFFARTLFAKEGWIAGSSPAMTPRTNGFDGRIFSFGVIAV